MMGIHHFETSTTASWKRSLDRKRPLGYHSNSYSWKGKERTPPFGQTARVCTGKQTNLGFSEGILPRQLEFSFFDGEVNVNFEWSTFCALGRRTIWGTRAIYGTHARPSTAPGAAAPGFHFQLEHARVEGKPRRRLFTMPEEEGVFDSVSAHLLIGHCCQTFLGGLVTQPK